MSQPRVETRPPWWKASTLEKSHLICVLIALPNIYICVWASEQWRMLVTWLPQCMCYMNIHEHTLTAPGCRPNSSLVLAWHQQSICQLPRHQHLQVRAFTVKQDRSRRGYHLWTDLTKVISILNYRSQDCHIPAGNRTRASTVGGEHSKKEPFEQLVKGSLTREFRLQVFFIN